MEETLDVIECLKSYIIRFKLHYHSIRLDMKTLILQIKQITNCFVIFHIRRIIKQ